MADLTYVSFDEARNMLRKWREEHARRSVEIVELWEHVLSRHPRSLGDELWLVYEQDTKLFNFTFMINVVVTAIQHLPHNGVCLAALDLARSDVVMDCIQALQERFPRSNRVLKLQAMRLEALKRYDSATHLYEQLIESDPTNMVRILVGFEESKVSARLFKNLSYRKRKIAILKAQNNRHEAIRELNEYLRTFISDTEAWLELSDLYLQEGDHPHAAHCMEELVLSSPYNSLYLRRLAEIRYTQGGLENIELARSYFEQAVRTNPSCCRSLYGIILCCINLSAKSSGQRKKEIVQSGLVAAEKLISRYEEASEKGKNPNVVMELETILNLKTQLQS
uniref:ER membrane protein complex subunit 2 n=1 Tax=Setaria digitata TaxID=48799 RepID=A0A915PTZ2_9BILA